MAAPNDLGPVVQSVTIAVLVIAWIAVGLRYYVRIFMVKSFGIDDWFITLTLINFTGEVIITFFGVHYGIGKHLLELMVVSSIANIEKAMKYWLILAVMYTVTMCLLKFSICLFLLRIASKNWHRYVLYTIMAVTLVFSLFFGPFLLFECHPVQNFWTLTQDHCLPERIMINVTIGHSALMALGDWACGILPIFLVWDIQMNKRMKITVALILMIGALGSVATVVRLVYVVKVSTGFDTLYETANVVIWSTIEPGMGITAVSVATLRPLFRKVLEKPIGLSYILGSGKGGSRQLSSLNANRNSRGYAKTYETEAEDIKMKRVQSQSRTRSENSDSSEMMFGSVPEEYMVTTTVKGMKDEKKPCAITKVKSRGSSYRDNERPVLPAIPVIYKTSEIMTESSSRDMV